MSRTVKILVILGLASSLMLLSSCASLAPKSQPVTINTPAPQLPATSSGTDSATAAKIGRLQENYNAVQNSLVGITGKVADFQTDIGKLADIKVDLAAIKGDIKLQSQIISTIKAEIKAEVKAEINSEIKAEITGIKSEMNGLKASVNVRTNSNLPLSFMIVFGVIMIATVSGLIFVIFQNSQQKKELKALRLSTPVIVPFEK